MSRFICASIIFFLFGSLNAQYKLTGYILDGAEVPHAYSSIIIKGENSKLTTQTNEEGRFDFKNLLGGTYELQILTAFGLLRKDLNLQKSIEIVITVPRTVKMDEVTVKASRVNSDMPFTFEMVGRKELESKNLGQDVPYLLKWTPSVVVTSDAGTGIGYTGIRIRGSDPTRTNVTINGIPLNDAESQTVFWVDLPDFLSSTESVQIQRGVGTSVNGAGAFGASINLNTNKLNVAPFAKINNSYGSFNTYKGNIQFGSGLLNNRWTIEGRLSKIHSDGYIDRAEADLISGFGSVNWFGNYTSLKMNVYHGKEVTYQAWNGVPVQYIEDKVLRKFNSAGAERADFPHNNEVDDYGQTHYQLLYDTRFNSFLRMNAAVHYTRGKGFFEQYKSGQDLSDYAFDESIETDLIRRRWLDNHFFGGLFNVNLEGSKDGVALDVGAAYHHYLGRHFGEVIWNAADVPFENVPNYYDNDATKSDFNIYGKIQSALFTNNLRGYVDLQQRIVTYEFVGLNVMGDELPQKVDHHFFNPKAGLTLRTQKNKGQLYASIAIAQKEPNRDDYTESSVLSRPISEKLTDFELGYRYKNNRIMASFNFYNMQYKDQILPTGQLNDVGAYTRQNVDNSFRRGVELSGGYAINDRLSLQGNATLSQNKIKEFTEYIDNWDYWNQDFNLPPSELEPNQYQQTYEKVDIAFSPNFIGALSANYKAFEKKNTTINIELSGKWVGKQFLDNTGKDIASLDPYFYTDFGIHALTTFKKGQQLSFNILLRNIFNELYSSNGWAYRFNSNEYDPRPDDPSAVLNGVEGQYNLLGYYPQATRNFLIGVQLKF